MWWIGKNSTRSALATGVMAIAMAGITGCVTKPSSVTVPLEYSPTTEGALGSFSLPEHPAKLYIAPVVDHREDQNTIGENEENSSKPIPVMASQMEPAQFVHDAVVKQLKSDGVTVVDSESDADRVLTLTMQKFWVLETSTYHASVELTGNLSDRSGSKAYWNGGTSGEDGTFGKSLSAGNYRQVLSNATAKAANNLLQRPDFVKSLSTQ